VDDRVCSCLTLIEVPDTLDLQEGRPSSFFFFVPISRFNNQSEIYKRIDFVSISRSSWIRYVR